MVQMTIYRCVFCNGPTPKGRADRCYCSVACKQKAYRWRQRIKRYEEKAMENIAAIGNYMQYPEARESAIQRLRGLKDTIDHQLWVMNVRSVK